MKEALGINSLNTKMKDIVKVVTQQGTGTVNIPSHGAIEATDYINIPELDGYTRVMTLIRPYGFASVVSSGPNSNWVTNTGSVEAKNVRLDSVNIFVKNI